MDEYIVAGIAMIFAAGITIAANLALREPRFRYLVFFGLVVINITMMLNALSLPLIASDELENIGLGIVISAITALTATAFLFEPVRVAISRWLPARVGEDTENLAESTAQPAFDNRYMLYVPILSEGEVLRLPSTMPDLAAQQTPYRRASELRGFDPRNLVHMVALIFCIYLFGTQLLNFVLGGGLSGIAEDTRIDALSLLLNFIPLLLVPILGVGLFWRRSWSQTLDRLGLAVPTLESIAMGVAGAFVLLVTQIALVVVWLTIVGEETFEKQSEAASAISESINTIWLALGVSLSAAIGEEIAFRGALQPVFGLWWTATFFTLIHMQYTLTPAALIIFVVALGLGWLRRRYNLYTAIIAHFLYNFVPLLLQQVFNS